MTASYWVAKYVADPFRNETRNVGVIVAKDGAIATRFVGERDDGVFDKRKLADLVHVDAYAQWRRFWKRTAEAADVEGFLRATTTNFFVERGGEVSGEAGDNASIVCAFLFDLVIGEGPLKAFGFQVDDDAGADLVAEIASAFEDLSLMPLQHDVFVRHPVIKNRLVAGGRVAHNPTFSQRNGHLYVFEHIDLSGPRINKTKERAGYMAYMFSDIKEAEPNSEAFSIIRPERNTGVAQIEFAKSVLGSESTIVNWSEEPERNRFLDQRRQIAMAA